MENLFKNIGLVILAILDYIMQPTIKGVDPEDDRKKKKIKIKILRFLKKKKRRQ